MKQHEILKNLNIFVDKTNIPELEIIGPFITQNNLIKFLNEVLELSRKKLNIIRVDCNDDTNNIVKIMVPPDVKLEPLIDITPDYINFIYSKYDERIKLINFVEFLDVCKINPEEVKYILQRKMFEVI
ncbi:MAG: hypothetical protein K9H48_07930 [Melioribacteraceae bacterium]|nr:hypothetical protein [Melioribacteraceae bacterium]